MGDIAGKLLRLLERASLRAIEHDTEWTSPAEVLPPDAEGMVTWKPVAIDPTPDFEALKLHQDLVEFYGSYFGWPPEGQHSGEVAILRVPWNIQELESIKKSIALHLSEEAPVCVAVTNSDWYFGVDNVTGRVWLCEPGYPPIREVAPNLLRFLSDMCADVGA
jgi:SecY interacting protein Syd